MKVADLSGSLRALLLHADGSTDIHEFRQLFAGEVVKFAAHCRSNRELIDALHTVLDPALGFVPLKFLGQGSTRRVYQLPFHIVMKLVRHDPEPRWAHNPRYLDHRRRLATFTEFSASCHIPLAAPRVYGVLFGLGTAPVNPDVAIVESVTPFEGERDNYFAKRDLYISGDTGRLLVRGVHELKTTDISVFDYMGGTVEAEIYSENLGLDSDGNHVFLDLGNNISPRLYLDERTFLPVGFDGLDDVPNYVVSTRLFEFYKIRLKSSLEKEASHL